jgi:hypothetical protein
MSHCRQSHYPLADISGLVESRNCNALRLPATNSREVKGFARVCDSLPIALFVAGRSGLLHYARDSLTRSLAASLHGSQTVLPLVLRLMQQTTQSPALAARALCDAFQALCLALRSESDMGILWEGS